MTQPAIAKLQLRAIAAAAGAGEELFMGIPDKWYEPAPEYGCDSGHVSRSYLKAEGKHLAADGQYYSGPLCLACRMPIYIIPHGYTDATLAEALTRIRQEH